MAVGFLLRWWQLVHSIRTREICWKFQEPIDEP